MHAGPISASGGGRRRRKQSDGLGAVAVVVILALSVPVVIVVTHPYIIPWIPIILSPLFIYLAARWTSGGKTKQPESTLKSQEPAELKVRESRTPGPDVRAADRAIVLPDEAKALRDAWRTAGDVTALTLADIVERVGWDPDPGPAEALVAGAYRHTWSRLGFGVSVLFGKDGLAIHQGLALPRPRPGRPSIQ